MDDIGRHYPAQDGYDEPGQRRCARPLIYVASSDVALVQRLLNIFEDKAFDCRFFPDGETLIAADVPDSVTSILLDETLVSRNGLQVQKRLIASDNGVPIIFISADVSTSVRAMKRGAIDVLTKPLDEAHLDAALRKGIWLNKERRRSKAARLAVIALAATLSPREREVMDGVAQGMLNKQIAFALGIAEITVKIHRRMVMRKMQVSSLLELVRKLDLV